MKDRFNLTDKAISHIAQLVQVAILTGTDIIDHMRMIRLVENESSLCLDQEYSSVFDGTLDKMMKNVDEQNVKE